jgi:hypothetical protein
MRLIETDSLTNQSLATAVSVGSYTADRARQIFFRVFAKQIAGNGDYVAYCKVDRGGLGTVYEMVPRTTAEVASGVTAIVLETMPLVVNTSDIISAWLVGLAGDTTTPDIDVEVWDVANEDGLIDVEVSDKTGFSLSGAGILAIWDALTADLDQAGSIGAYLVARLDATVSSILAAVSQNFTSAGGGTASQVQLPRADTWAQGLTVNAFAWAAGDKLLLTIKERDGSRGYRVSSTDVDSVLQWLLSYDGSLTDGLTYVNQAAAADRTKGSLAVVSASGGTLTVNLDETISAQIRDRTYVFDVVHISAAGVRTTLTATGSLWTVDPTVTRTVA